MKRGGNAVVTRCEWATDVDPLYTNHWKSMKNIHVTTDRSDAMSKDLKRRGFKFTGPTICYAYMQAVGMVDGHTIKYFCYQ